MRNARASKAFILHLIDAPCTIDGDPLQRMFPVLATGMWLVGAAWKQAKQIGGDQRTPDGRRRGR